MSAIDAAWIAAHPLPVHADGTDKNARGRVLIAGGSEQVPGALRLTGEAALRGGAGKVQLATIAAAAIPLGLLMPEAATIALPAGPSGEIAADAAPILRDAIGRCDAFILGPGMGERACAQALVEAVLGDLETDAWILLDAAAVACIDACGAPLSAHAGRLVITPHHGEMAELSRWNADALAADPIAAAQEVAERYGAVVVLKAGATVVAAPGADVLRYAGGGVGLGTGGSGDVLAGLIGALLARGAEPRVAAAWGVWLHGEAGRQLAERVGPIGFLAREIARCVPMLMQAGIARQD